MVRGYYFLYTGCYYDGIISLVWANQHLLTGTRRFYNTAV